MATITQADRRSVRSPLVFSVGAVMASALLIMLVINPPLLYWDDVNLFSVAGISINVRFVLLLATCSVALLVVLLTGSLSLPLPLLLFSIFFLLGIAVSIIQGLSIRWWLPPLMRWSGAILVAWAGFALTKSGYLNIIWYHRALLICISVPIIFGIAQATLGLAPLLNGAFRLYGPFVGSPLNYALFLAALVLLLLGRDKLTWTDRVILAVASALLLATHSRLVIAAFAVCVTLLLLLQRRFMLVLLLFGGAVLMFLFSTTLTEQLLGRFSTILTINGDVLQRAPFYAFNYQWEEAGIDNSVLLRFQTHFVGWEAFLQAPIFGNGLGSFVPLYEARTGRPDIAAHNDYLLYLVETGLVGVIFYISLQIRLIWWLLRPPAYVQSSTQALSLGVGVAYICINVFSFLSNPYYFFDLQFWIWLGLGIALALRHTDRERYRRSVL